MPFTENDIQVYRSTHPKVEEWLGNFHGKTPRLYTRAILAFEAKTNINLETLLDQIEENKIKLTEIRTLIIKAAKDLSNPNQVRLDSALRSFFKYWAQRLPTTTIRYQQTKDYEAYTKTELNQLLGYLDKPLEKLYVIIAAESGLRADTILSLKWRHLKDDFNNRTNSIAIRLEPEHRYGRKKSGITFIGTRARELLRQATEQRLIQTEDEAYIFPWANAKNKTNRTDSIRKAILIARKKARINPNISPIHGLRKFNINALITAHIEEQHRKVINGRFNDADAKAYTTKKHDELRPSYEQAYPYLDYMNNAPDKTQELSTRQTELQDTIRQQNGRIATLEEQLRYISAGAKALPSTWATMDDEVFEAWIIYQRIKREQIKDPNHPVAKASDAEIIGTLKSLVDKHEIKSYR